MSIIDGGNASGTATEIPDNSVLQEIIGLVGQQLQDDTGKTWPPDELLPYINLSLAKIISVKPEAYPVTKIVPLIEGSRQSVDPAVEVWIIDAICNMVGGVTQGPAITWLPRKSMDQMLPDWQLGTTIPVNATVMHCIRDEHDPYTFYTFPPQPSNTTQGIQMIMSEVPPKLLTVSDTFPLNPIYKNATVNMVVHFALGEETTISGAQEKSMVRLQMALQDLGINMPQAKKQGGTSAPQG
jgi:hypothetical protein